MGANNTGSADVSFQWKSIFQPDPGLTDCHNTFYEASPVVVGKQWVPKSAYAIRYLGTASVMGNTSQTEPYQRPALYIFDSYGKYRSST